MLRSPVGFVCPNVDGSGNRKCLPGTYVLGSVCASCTAGYECPDGIVRSACPAGRFSASAAAACTICPAGSACTDPADPSAVAPCPTGTFSVAGASACSPCPAGFTCLTQATDQISACSPGRYSPLGTMFCLDCPPGSSCVDPASAPVPCPTGQYSAVNSVNCTSCPPGYECPTPDVNPVRCTIGRFSSGGATSCSPCTPGYRCVVLESHSRILWMTAVLCVLGISCPAGSTETAPPGSECPMGWYCNPSSTLTPCPAGTYGILTAGTSEAHACTVCDAGTHLIVW
jgi:hypothetical protein